MAIIKVVIENNSPQVTPYSHYSNCAIAEFLFGCPVGILLRIRKLDCRDQKLQFKIL